MNSCPHSGHFTVLTLSPAVSSWRGRNKGNNINRGRVKDDELFKVLLENNFNMRQSLIIVGLAAKGGNYGRCHRLKREYEEICKNTSVAQLVE